MSGADLGTGMFNDARDERSRSSPEEDSDADQAECLEQDAGIERQDQRVLAPVPQSAGDQGIINPATVDGWIFQPATESAFRTLRQRLSSVDVGEPVRERAALGQQRSTDHPG